MTDIRKILFLIPTMFLLATFSKDISFFLAKTLPLGMIVKSKGSFFPGFGDEYGFSLHLRVFAIAIILFSPLLMLSRAILSKVEIFLLSEPRQGVRLSLILIVGLFAYGWYSYLAFPPYAYTANAYYHWVENWFNPRMATAYPMTFFLHALFDNHPEILQGMLIFSIAMISYVIARTMSLSFWCSLLLIISLCLSPMLMNFAHIAEDVLIQQLLILCVLYCYIKRLPYLVGVAMFLLLLGRFQFLVIIACFVFAEVGSRIYRCNRKEAVKNFFGLMRDHFFFTNAALFSVLCFLQFLYRKATTGITQTDQLSRSLHLTLTAKVQDVDGFTIFPGSMTYLGHFTWIFPCALMICGLIVWRNYFCLRRESRAILLFASSFIFANIIMHDIAVGFYFNHRYLSYYLPLMVVVFVSLLFCVPNISFRTKLFLMSVVLGTLPFQNNSSLKIQREAARRELTELYSHRRRLLEVARGKDVYTTYEVSSDRVYLSYIFRKLRRTFEGGGEGNRIHFYKRSVPLVRGSILVQRKSENFPCDPIITTKKVKVCYVI